MDAYGFCLEFQVPDDIDIGGSVPEGGNIFRDVIESTPTLEAVRSAVDTDDRWSLKRVVGSNPTLFVCVEIKGLTEDEARRVARGGVYDVVTNVIPGARFREIKDD